ncbi:MAG: hypothetical protein ACP5NW_04595 [Candidatus Woesearchaeota archaeon]
MMEDDGTATGDRKFIDEDKTTDHNDKKQKNTGRRFVRGVLYTAGAAFIGGAGYLFGKYRHLDGKSRNTATYTVLGLALIVGMPKGCDIVEKCLDSHTELAKVRIYSSVRKDSIDAVLDLKRPKDTSLLYLKDFFEKASENNKILERKYSDALSNTSEKYNSMIEEGKNQYTSVLNDLTKQNENLKQMIDGLKLSQSSNDMKGIANDTESASNDKKNNTLFDKYRGKIRKNNTSLKNNISSNAVSMTLDDIASGNDIHSLNASSTLLLEYYLIDADKSDGEINVYGVCNDGSAKHLSITSKASFAMSGGPNDGKYALWNKGIRYGDLYPGFLAIDDPVGISGAGENNEHLEEIQNGDWANKSGIRVPNEIYTKIARLVDEKKTIIHIHE